MEIALAPPTLLSAALYPLTLNASLLAAHAIISLYIDFWRSLKVILLYKINNFIKGHAKGVLLAIGGYGCEGMEAPSRASNRTSGPSLLPRVAVCLIGGVCHHFP